MITEQLQPPATGGAVCGTSGADVSNQELKVDQQMLHTAAFASSRSGGANKLSLHRKQTFSCLVGLKPKRVVFGSWPGRTRSLGVLELPWDGPWGRTFTARTG